MCNTQLAGGTIWLGTECLRSQMVVERVYWEKALEEALFGGKAACVKNS